MNTSVQTDETPRYPFREIERTWQKRWADADIYKVDTSSTKPKFYTLVMFPYPSGSGLHVGHGKNYIPGDVLARHMRMKGYNVLNPMGWDAFGQPAEQDAIKRGVNPRTVVPQLAAEYRRQLETLGVSYDWSREINSTEPAYYKWNQWAFLLLLERGLAYRDNAPVNWCVNESTVLANEEVVDGKCWRCDGPVVQKPLPQWKFKITAYADKLIAGLDTINWPEGVKTQQREWIGRSEGAEVDFAVSGDTPANITVFTTRPDTLWGATFLVLAPEHPLVATITTEAQKAAVNDYIDAASRASEQDRTAENRPKTGVFTGAYAQNPVNGEDIPIWIADYVLTGYGTGAIMAVPAHDQRDFDFAKAMGLAIRLVYRESDDQTDDAITAAFAEGGTLRADIGAPESIVGLPNDKYTTVPKVLDAIANQGYARKRVNYRLRDWLVSRQRYWGTPIPIIHCPACGIVPVPVDQLPVLLPDVENYKPGNDGRSPLASIPEFVNCTCPTCGGAAERETDTMAGSVDSSWYFLRFTSPDCTTGAWDRAAADYWMPVDLYLGGREHAVGHLLYCRFFTKVFHDAGLLTADEPAYALRNQGMLLAESFVDKENGHPIKPDELHKYNPDQLEKQWLKMSKSKGNAVTPDEMADSYGADALRLYICFEAPFEDTIQWSEERMSGTFRFLSRSWDVIQTIAGTTVDASTDHADARSVRRKVHQTIAKVSLAIADLRMNTVVSSLMILQDVIRKFVTAGGANHPAAREAAEAFTLLLAPLAPHTADALWELLGHANTFTINEAWPESDSEVAAEDEVTVVVQVNGKLRDKLTLPAGADNASTEAAAMALPKIVAELDGKTIRKVIVVPNKLVNIVAG
jgi:leucyl-tRNA synthetase